MAAEQLRNATPGDETAILVTEIVLLVRRPCHVCFQALLRPCLRMRRVRALLHHGSFGLLRNPCFNDALAKAA